ncbi:MAG: hypothetical protein HKL90_04060 [Elusimicrobia bacterium]|nr:hypothetical protein [Elusimicrobiota bacterium]
MDRTSRESSEASSVSPPVSYDRDSWRALTRSVVLTLAVVGPICWWSRDFGVFLFIYTCFLPIFSLVCIFFIVRVIFTKDPSKKRLAVATFLAVIATIAMTFIVDHSFHERISFLFWYPAHYREVANYAGKEGVICSLDSNGMAGMSVDAYLVSDPSDSIADPNSPSGQKLRYPPECDADAVASVQRLWRGLYIVTMMNCPLG